MNRWKWLCCIALIGATACTHGAITPDQVQGPLSWGEAHSVTQLRHLWFAGQPDESALERAKAEGIRVVINLRDPSEQEWDEQAAAEGLGMTYYNVPIRGGQPFERAAFERIETIVEQHHGESTLVHCSSSNRAGAWLATHLVRRHGMPVEDALSVGRRAGITKEAMEKNVRRYLEETGDLEETADRDSR